MCSGATITGGVSAGMMAQQKFLMYTAGAFITTAVRPIGKTENAIQSRPDRYAF